MTIQELEDLTESCLTDTENCGKVVTYEEAIKEYLDKNGIDDEIVYLVVKGINIDRGANFYDYFGCVSKKDLQNAWKIIRDNKCYEEFPENGIKYVFGLLYMALIDEGSVRSILGAIITKICRLISEDNKTIPQEIYGPFLIDYVVNDFPNQNELPGWEGIKATPEMIKGFTLAFLGVLNKNEGVRNFHKFKIWLNKGISYAEEKIEEKNIEARIPVSKISELKKIVNHYEEVEKLLHDLVYQEANLSKTIEKKTKEISELEKTKMEMEREIKSLNDTVTNLQKKVETSKKEIEDRKKINAAQTQFREDSQASLLQNIADSLKAEYEDYALTKDEPMDEMLGEIYRVKLENVFKILGQKGIKVMN